MPETDTANVYEELNRLRKAAKLALAFQAMMQATNPDGIDATDVADSAADTDRKNWEALARLRHISRPSEATIALAIDLLASAARHPSAARP
jgi:hypothetical protein